MSSIKFQTNRLLIGLFSAVIFSACSDGSNKKTTEEETLKTDTAFATVERMLDVERIRVEEKYADRLNDFRRSPLDFEPPYAFNPGAQLLVRSGLEVDATLHNVLQTYFGEGDFDVKDLSISKDGSQLLFAAHGPLAHPRHNTWNIYTFHFETKVVQRVIEDDFVANAGHDTNPIFSPRGSIIFSSDRDAGDPSNPRENIELVGELCEKVDPMENPSLLHSMSVQGANITQLTYGRTNHDIKPTALDDGRIAFIRWERSFQSFPSCHLTEQSKNSYSKVNNTALSSKGFKAPEVWSDETKCQLAKLTESGVVAITNHYKVLAFDHSDSSLEQLYNTVTASTSDEAFLSLDRIVQSENGRLYAMIKHHYHPVAGGALIELQSTAASSNNDVFAEISPVLLTDKIVDLYPDQLSENGWYSSFWPYRDGSSRLLVSWAQCKVLNNGVSEFCNDTHSFEDVDVSYGIWVFDPNHQNQSPIVRAKPNALFSEIVISQPHKSLAFPYDSFNPNFIDNDDGTEIVCQFPNTAPIAHAGNDLVGYVGDDFSLNGSLSEDSDGDPLTYQWSVIEQPQTSTTTFNNDAIVNPIFSADKAGRYVIELIVYDGKDYSTADTMNIRMSLRNQMPIAKAGDDQSGIIGSSFQLDGTQSSDPDNDTLSYRWLLLTQPEGSQTVIQNNQTATPTVTPDKVGHYVAQLIVNDGQMDSAADSMNISVSTPPNQKPTAVAGNDQRVLVNQSVLLSGAASHDPEGQVLSYRWAMTSKPATSSASLLNGQTVSPNFTPDVVGNYQIQLIVNDGQMDSEVDVVHVIAEKNNQAPIARAGADQFIILGASAQLSGSASSDPDNDELIYQWTLVGKPSESQVVLTNANNVNTSVQPDKEGEYQLQLVVNDGELSSTPDLVMVIATRSNQAPVADAGIDQSILLGANVQLDGSRSLDPDGDPLTYQWNLVSIPDGSAVILSSSENVSTEFTPDKEGVYVAQLMVSDDRDASHSDSVSITVTRLNEKPVSDAGNDQQGWISETFTLDGSSSFDPEGELLQFQWSILSQPETSALQIDNPTQASISITPSVEGEYRLQLLVSDGEVTSEPDTVMVTVNRPNRSPVANAGHDQSFKLEQLILLDGSNSYDEDGDSLTYHWQIVSPENTASQLSDSRAVSPSITPDSRETFVIQLVVNDGTVDSVADTVSLSFLNTKPVANAGLDQTAQSGEQISLDGSGSRDQDGDALTYRWTLSEKPQGSQAELENAETIDPKLILDAAGRYQITLVVNDGELDSEVDTVLVNSESNTQPVARAGEDRIVQLNDTVVLDGSKSSDADANPLTFSWTITSRPATSQASLVDSQTMTPAIAIDVRGEYVLQLIVNDGYENSLPDSVLLTTQNLRPIAEAGEAQTAYTGDTVELNGSQSYDPDGDPLSYQWTLLHKPSDSVVQMSEGQSEVANFVPDVKGTYVAQLIVSDGELISEADTVSIIVSKNDGQCEVDDSTSRTFPIIIRDFKRSHPDFEYNVGVDYGIVKDQLGQDGKPVYAHEGSSTHTTTGNDNFVQWYRDIEDVNLTIHKSLTMTREPNMTLWEYRNDNFFPIDGEGWGNTGLTNPDHNYHFTLETHLAFDYKGGEVFTFRGDDDLWLFINGRLAIDIGGVHSVIEKSIDLDMISHILQIEPGGRYTFDLFFAERHTTKSNFMFQTNMDLECVPIDD